MDSILKVTVGSDDVLAAWRFSIQERMNALFRVEIVATSEDASIDFRRIVGHAASFELATASGPPHIWEGICSEMRQIAAIPTAASTYQLTLVPTLWLTTQRRNYRMFQYMSEPDIVKQLLDEWNIEAEFHLDSGSYKGRKYRVQYGESDYAFMSRLLEDVGISFYFERSGGKSRLVLSDAPHTRKATAPVLFVDTPDALRANDHVTAVSMSQRVRPGRYTIRDHDYRRPPNYELVAEATGGRSAVEAKLERYHYIPGAFLFNSDQGQATPAADDRGSARHDEAEGTSLAQKRLHAKQAAAESVAFNTNVYGMAPGVVMSMLDHPHALLAEDHPLLILSTTLSGSAEEEWDHQCEACTVEIPYRPPLQTRKPRTQGVESATVVGPVGDEIHTDEFGRVRVQFHWDRHGQRNESSSCWIHVSQPWSGAGFGGVNLPRVGQEVLVDFLGGDPDRPVIVGRVFTNLQKLPYKLPDNKTQSGWKSYSSPGGSEGFNEFMFEDLSGEEKINIQAQKDLAKLVKNNEAVTIGNNRTKSIGNNDILTVASNRTKLVGANESVTVASNQAFTVGVNRSSTVGMVNTVTAGAVHQVSIVPGTVSAEAAAPAASTPTELKMEDRRIKLTTGLGASIVLEDDKITILARTITVRSIERTYMRCLSGDTTVSSLGDTTIISTTGTTKVAAAGGDVLIKGGPMVKINP